MYSDTLLFVTGPSKKLINTYIACIVVASLASVTIGFLLSVDRDQAQSYILWKSVLQCRENASQANSISGFSALLTVGAGIMLAGGGSVLEDSNFSVYRSTDNGETWANVYIGDFGPRQRCSLVYMSNGDIFGLSNGKIIRSSDLGIRWTSSDLPYSGASMAEGDGTLIISKDGGQIYRSTDNGKNFASVNFSSQSDLIIESISHSAGEGFLIGARSGFSDGYVFRSSDGGMTWTQVLYTSQNYVSSVFAASDGLIIGTASTIYGEATIRRSADGVKWQTAANLSNFAKKVTTIRSFFKSKSGRLFACCDCSYSSSSPMADEPSSNRSSVILSSSDSGVTWSLFSDRVNTKRLYALSETSDGCLIAATGEFGQILKSNKI